MVINSNNYLISGNQISTCQYGVILGMLYSNGVGVVRNNLFTNIGTIGIEKYSSNSGYIENVQIIGNTIDGSGWIGIDFNNAYVQGNIITAPYGISTWDSNHNRIIGNMITPGSIGIDAAWSCFVGYNNNGELLLIEGNTITNGQVGITVTYLTCDNDDPSAARYFTVKNNNIQYSFGGINVDGGNDGQYFPQSKVQGNSISTATNYGISIQYDAQGITVSGNNIASSPTALQCYRTGGITWSCNNCNGGAVQNDQCTPEAFCRACGGPSSSPTIMKTQLVTQAPSE